MRSGSPCAGAARRGRSRAGVSPPARPGPISPGGMSLKPIPRPGPGRLLLRGLLGLALLAALAAAGHALLWRWMAGRLEAGFQDWAALRRDQGWRGGEAGPGRGGGALPPAPPPPPVPPPGGG